MAQTKVKLVSNGVITVDNLHTNHGITTDHIGEGSVLYYTDARVANYLTTNNYITTTDVASLETTTSLSLAANILSYVDEAGNTTNLDLSLYLDDTNLARLVSGTLDGGTGIATFTRDDATTFTVDFSAFLSDANDYVTSAAFNTSDGVLTLTRLGGGTVTVDLDNRYLTSFTETDPIYTASSWYTTTNNSSNWDTAYGWGDHTGRYMTEGLTLTGINTIVNGGNRYDPSTNNPTNEHYAVLTYGNRGNVTGQLATHFVTGNLYSRGYNSSWSAWRRYWNDTDFTSTNVSNWNTAYGWGNHASAGYLTSFTESDPVFSASAASGITSTQVSNWDTAYSWGNHASAGYAAASSLSGYLPLTGGTISGVINLNDSGYLKGSPTYGFRFNNSVDSINALIVDNSGNSTAYSSHRAPIFYDSNDTTYYMDPNSTSSGRLRGNLYFNDYGAGIIGTYSSTRYQGVFSMGDAYKLPVDGTSISNLYGMAWSHPNAGGVAGNLNTHGLLVTENGTFLAAISGSVRSRDDMRAPIFYDSNDTAYYLDPTSTSRLGYLVPNKIKLVGSTNNEPRWDFSAYVVEAQHWYGNNASQTMYLGESGNAVQIPGSGGIRPKIVYNYDDTSKYWTRNTSTYTSHYIGGNQNGYSGFRVDGDMHLMIHTSGVGAPCGFWNGSWSLLTYVNGPQYLYYNGAEKLRTDSGGTVISGTLYATGDVIAYYSDIRLKKDIENIDSAIDKIKKLRGVTYTWNNNEVNVIKERYGKRDIGLIAQEVEAVEPLFVTEYKTQLNTPSEDPNEASNFEPEMSESFKTIKYEKLVALLIEGIKEQQQQIDELKSLLNK